MPSTDMTYCASDCQLTGCPRHESQMPEHIRKSESWESWSDLSEDCPDYTPPLDAA